MDERTILNLQAILSSLGYLTVRHERGELDDATHAALHRFQQIHRLNPANAPDDATWESLFAADRKQECVVAGTVEALNGPLSPVLVVVRDRDLGERASWPELGVVPTEPDGSFVIIYASESVAPGDKRLADGAAVADLVIELARLPAGLETAEFDIVRLPEGERVSDDDRNLGIQARRFEEVRITVKAQQAWAAGSSEYERLLAAFREVWPEQSPASLDEQRSREVTFVARELGEPVANIAALVNSFKWAEEIFRSDIAPEVLYGLARSHKHLTTLQALGTANQRELEAALLQASNDHIIPVLSSDQLAAAIALIVRTGASTAATQPVVDGLPSFAQRIETGTPDPAAQATLLQTYAEHNAEPAEFWRQLRGKPGFTAEGAVEQAQFALQLDALTQSHLPLMKTLQAEQGLKSPRQLLQFGEERLREVLARTDVGIPAEVPGADEAERVDNYVTSVIGALHLALPTESVAIAMQALPPDGFGGEQVKAAVATFFQHATADSAREAGKSFDIRNGNLRSYLSSHADTVFAGVDDEDRARATGHILRAQRLFNVSTSPGSFSALMSGGFDSARDIATTPHTAFLAKMKDTIGPQQAMMAHNNAVAISAFSVEFYTRLNELMRGLMPTAIEAGNPDGLRDVVAKHIPNWKELFGSPELCACTHCRSVYSPAAYLVDILHFLEKSTPNAQGLTPLDVLIGKQANGASVMGLRPDLAHLKLSCENTNTAIPYLDLVNEILECLALSWATIAESDGLIRADAAAIEARDTGTTTMPELKASPQYTQSEAYQTPDAAGSRERLDRVAWPLPLPYDAALEAARVYLQYLGVAAEQLMETFAAKDETTRALAESLRISPREFAVLTGQNFDGTPAAALSSDALYGFTAELLPRLETGAEGIYVSVLKQKLNTRGAGLPLAAEPAAEVFDAATVAAVVAFQTAAGLAPNGVAGVAEWRALHAVEPGVSPLLLPNVRELLRRSSLAYEELVSLCEMRFLNPQRDVFSILQRLRLPHAGLSAWIAAGLAGDPGADVIAALAAAAVPLAQFKAWAQDNLQGPTWDQARKTLVLEAPLAEPCNLDRMWLRHWDETNPQLTAPEWHRINRTVRLWRKLGWEIHVLDRVLVALGATDITPDVVRQLALIRQAQKELDLPPDEVAALWSVPDVTSETSFFRKRFGSKAALRNDPAFAPDWKGDVLQGTKISEHVAALLSGLRLKAEHLDAIRKDAFAPGSDELSTASLWVIARYAILSRALDLRVPDFTTLRQLSGIDPFTPPATPWPLKDLLVLARRFNESDLSIAQADYLFRGGADHALAPDAAAVDRSLAELEKALAQIAAEYTLEDDPRGAITRARLDTICPDPALVTRFIQMIDGSAVYATPLAAMPPGLAWPPAFANRISFDAAAAMLVVRGALTESERMLLRGLSASVEAAIDTLAAAPRKTLKDLLAGITGVAGAIPQAEARLLDTSSFDAAGKVDAAAVAAKFEHVLKSILPPVRDAARRARVKQQLAEAFGLETGLLALLIERNPDGRILLHARGAPTEPLIADFFDPVDIGNARRGWLRLHKSALVLGLFDPTAAELAALAGRVFDLDQLPDEAPAAYNPAPFTAFQDVLVYVAMRDALPPAATPLAQVFAAAELNAALARLSEATGHPQERLALLVGAQGFAMDLATVQSMAGLSRLETALTMLNRLGIAPAQAFSWARQPITPAVADDVKRAARAPLSDAQWLGVAKSLNDPLREGRRDALVAYLLPRMGLETSAQLYEQLLIDVDMSACMMTSRVKQAAASVQLFIQRCLLNLEPRVPPANIDAEQWGWMKRYRVWEANRKVFLYPENWIEPELRDDKTPFFKELESALLQNDVTDANVEQALLNYLEKLNSVAKLHLCGMFVQTDFEPTEKLKQVVHVFGRTLNTPYAYHYRRYVVDANGVSAWTPWEPVPVDVRGEQIAPVVFNRRLYLFWPVLTHKAEEPSSYSSKPTPPQKYTEVQVAWSEYSNGKWSPKYISDPEQGLRMNLPGRQRRLDAYVSVDTLSVVYSVQEIVYMSYVPGFSISGIAMPMRTVSGNIATAERHFEFDNCYGALQLRASRWTQSWVSGYGINASDIQPLGNGVIEPFDLLGQNTDGAVITEEHKHHVGSDYFGYEDAHRVYFGHVKPKWDGGGKPGLLVEPGQVKPDLGKYGDLLYKPFDVKNDLGRPYFAQVAQAAAGASDPWMGATASLGLMSLQEPAPAVTMSGTTKVDSTATLIDTRPAYALAIDFSKFTLATDVEVRYEIFYHPFTCHFISRLRRYGVPGLLNLSNQQLQLTNLFQQRYKPTNNVVQPYPVEHVDFGRVGQTSTYRVTAYSCYNWELFFHVPVTVAVRLSENQRFEEAMRWYHYVFNPTDGKGGYWKVLPFRTTPKETIEQLLTSLNAGQPEAARQVAEWRDHPFQPHLIARMRLIAYQKFVVMKYIDNLIAWGDQLFHQDTIETLNEATQLYVLAATLLGPRPQQIPASGEAAQATFAELRHKLDPFSNALTSFENQFPHYTASSMATTKEAIGLLGIARSFYFCIPQNERLLGYWDTVADRLFKIRHCMNIGGVVRELPLFEPPIDPALLVRAAARGVDIGSVLSDLNAPAPYYRFTHMLQKALDMCTELKALGAQILSVLEKQDAEHLALMRQQHEGSILAMGRLLREKQVEDAENALEALRTMRQSVVTRYQDYQSLLGAQGSAAPEEGADIPLTSARRKTSAAGGAHLIDEETGELDSAHLARDWGVTAATTETLAGILHYIPNFVVKVAPFGVGTQIEIGGRHIGPAMGAIARYQRSQGEQNSYDAATFRRMAEHTRREQQWVRDSNQAAGDIMHIDKQLLGLQVRLEIARQELRNHDKNIENATAVEEFLRTKYTNKDLYSWMQAKSSELFFRTYQLAYDFARKTERAFQFELGLGSSDFVRFGAWDSLRKGLLCGEQLALQLRQLDRAWHEGNKREYEITKHISLLQLDPLAFVQLKETGSCEFEVPEALFDLDFPGQYFRRLRTVSLTIPCVAGPYTSIGATLTLLNHRVRTKASTAAAYPEQPGEDEKRFRRDFVPLQSVALSSANNDSGVFEPNLRDERYLPFEGAGVISRWRLQLPQRDPEHPETSFAQFDYDTISDAILHVKYTAREGGEALAAQVRDSLEQTLNELNTIADEGGLFRLFSLRHEFPDVWRQLRQTGRPVEFQIPKNRLPYLVQARKVTLQSVFQVASADQMTPIADPQFDPAKDSWNLQVAAPAVDASDILLLFVYTIN